MSKIRGVYTEKLAEIIAGLVERGIIFEVFPEGQDTWEIRLTGGH
jgi:hypothetical protein